MNNDEAVRRLTEVIRRQALALATERSCCAWLRRYRDFLKGLPLHLPSEHKQERFLTALAQKDVAASTQNQTFNPFTFFLTTPARRRSSTVARLLRAALRRRDLTAACHAANRDAKLNREIADCQSFDEPVMQTVEPRGQSCRED